MNRFFWLFPLILIILVCSCTKDILVDPGLPEFKNIQEVSVSDKNANISYQLSNNVFTETGVYYSEKKEDLVNNVNTTIAKAIEKNGTYKAIFQPLKPLTSYYYKIYYKRSDNSLIYHNVLEFKTVNFNLSFPSGFDKVLTKNSFNIYSLIIEGNDLDINKENFVAQVGNSDIKATGITKSNSLNKDQLIFNFEYFNSYNIELPLKIYFKGVLVYSDQINLVVDREMQFYSAEHKINLQYFGGVSFSFDNKIYHVNNDIKTYDPSSNTLSKLNGIPPNDFAFTGFRYAELNREIYFSPFLKNDYFIVRVFSPVKNTWRDIKLLSYNDKITNRPTTLSSHSLITHGGKLYIAFRVSSGSPNDRETKTSNNLYVYDPAKDTFEKVMVFDDSLTGFHLASFNNKIYLYARVPLYDDIFRYGFTMGLFEMNLLDLNIKKIKLFGEGNDAEIIDYYSVFNFRNTFYVHYENGFLEYIPAEGKMRKISTVSSVQIPKNQSNVCQVGNDIYLTTGNYSNAIVKINFP